MFDDCVKTERDTVFTLYFKQQDVFVNLSKQELVNLIEESVELLKLTGNR